ncbi:Cyanamide hydratase [Seminavis robusta]|uniref:Cyanamide hydratase n=1 Tax=Seminavis robusta TaxID=568900 RepID=A0A9N8DE56_9STRA|nr:Cyanamide hydratase [Seminavis robusta]|eukprot:Sro30_g019760.1 Cyanamide hydratase (317) ;mRNA; r:121317-122267
MSLIRASISLAVPATAASIFFPDSVGYVAGGTAVVFLFAKTCSRPLANHAELDKIPYSCSSPPKEQQLTLTTCLIPRPKLRIILDLGGIKLEQLATSIAMALGLRRIPRPISDIDDPIWTIPTTEAAQAALALCQKTAGPHRQWIVNHCLRTFRFGAAVAEQLGTVYDEEVLFVASLLHDLAWTEPFDRDDLDFELLGAQAARDFCIHHGMSEHKSNVIHEMIALHTSPHILGLPEYAPEIRLVSQGAGMDVAGLFCEEISSETKLTVVKEHPRLNFKKCCCALMADHARRKPDTHMAVSCQMGFLTAIRMGPFDE